MHPVQNLNQGQNEQDLVFFLSTFKTKGEHGLILLLFLV